MKRRAAKTHTILLLLPTVFSRGEQKHFSDALRACTSGKPVYIIIFRETYYKILCARHRSRITEIHLYIIIIIIKILWLLRRAANRRVISDFSSHTHKHFN